jgi:bifunctional pyridoxal-dependent enzyme with beta-cystathionase and maltose regulon repressor activities
LSDEIWSDIIFQPHVYTSIASINNEIKNQTVIVTGYSKSYGLAGLRVGAIIAPNESLFHQILEKSGHQSTIHGCNVLAQVAASTALNECGDWLNQFVTHLTSMRDLCVTELNKLDGFECVTPQGCYLVFPDITKTGYTAQQMQTLLLEKAKVAVVPGLGQWFGSRADGHIRISFATSKEVLQESFSRIHKALKA